ncbi:MAG: pyridoxal phosphate-dependent aminotransferase [Myxococcota bacterium]|nr:pyridoxal phosphate-dependent aminotransferase [Myxococcota bacterium]
MFSGRSRFERDRNAPAVAIERARAAGRRIVDLTVSNPTAAGIPYDAEAILAALSDPRALRYEPEPFGLPAAREAVAGLMAERGVQAPAGRIVLTASTSEAYAFLFNLLCDPGDEVLVPAPSYPLLDMLARLESVRLVPYRLEYDGEWRVDVDSLRAAVTGRSRAVATVSPNNPTGSCLKREELAAIASLGLPIVSDEVFASYPLRDDARRAVSALEAGGSTLVFALGGLSKLAALPQMKLAWTAVGGPAAAVDEALARLDLIADCFLSAGTPVQHALPRLLASRATAEGAVMARIRSNLDLLRAAFGSASPVSLLEPEAGWYAVLRLPRTRSEEEWVLDLLERHGVLVQPGWFYDFADEPYVVVSLLTPPDDLREGVERLLDLAAG